MKKHDLAFKFEQGSFVYRVAAIIIHDNNPVLSWAMGNAVTTGGAKVGISEKGDRNENFMLDKQKSPFRIDPAASMMNAHVRIWLNEQPGKRVYETGSEIFSV
jgi:phage terminase large subunit-like protein